MIRLATSSSIGAAEEDDVVLEQARVDVVGALAPVRLLDHHRNQHASGLSLTFFGSSSPAGGGGHPRPARPAGVRIVFSRRSCERSRPDGRPRPARGAAPASSPLRAGHHRQGALELLFGDGDAPASAMASSSSRACTRFSAIGAHLARRPGSSRSRPSRRRRRGATGSRRTPAPSPPPPGARPPGAGRSGGGRGAGRAGPAGAPRGASRPSAGAAGPPPPRAAPRRSRTRGSPSRRTRRRAAADRAP